MFKQLFIFFFLFFSSCGYHCMQPKANTYGESFSVSQVEGDKDGMFTQALIKELSAQLPVSFVNENPDLLLKVKILSYREENTSFAFDPEQNKAYANEKRSHLKLEYILQNTLTGKELVGPVELKVDHDFDFHQDPSSAIYKANLLGILDMGQEVSKEPLYVRMAQKVAHTLIERWPL